MPTVSDIAAIVMGLSGLLVALWSTWASRKRNGADLAEIYKSIAGIDAKSLLELKKKVDRLERARRFRAVFTFDVDGEGARAGTFEITELALVD